MERSKRSKRRLLVGSTINVAVNGLVFAGLAAFSVNRTDYWKFGPSEDFHFLGAVVIDKYWKWVGILVIITILEFSRVYSEELVGPILAFTIYDPDKRVINDFTYGQLRYGANMNRLGINTWTVIQTMIVVSRADFTLWLIVISQIASDVAIRTLLRDKQFKDGYVGDFSIDSEKDLESLLSNGNVQPNAISLTNL
jgi:hypothetical protein